MKRFIDNEWFDLLASEFAQPYYQTLRHFLAEEYRTHTVYPPMECIWTAFQKTPYHHVKVVILGQDPYHGPNQAQGMSFSVPAGIPLPPSLRNIYQELESDLGIPPAAHGDLSAWAEQGVFLLNTVLTVRAQQAYSHRGHGWEQLTDAVIRLLNARTEPIVFLLWGNPAIRKKEWITAPHHTVLTAPHPSPLSAHRGFFGARPFSRANEALQQYGVVPINWALPEVITNQ